MDCFSKSSIGGERKMSRRNSREGGKGGEDFLVECEKCKQWISGGGLGLDGKGKEDEFCM